MSYFPDDQSNFDHHKEQDVVIKSLKDENQRLKLQRTLSQPTSSPITNCNFKNETKPCYQPDYSLIIYNRIARNDKNEETIITRGLSSVTVQRLNRSRPKSTTEASPLNPLSAISKVGSNFKIGDQDKLINSFNKNEQFEYAMVLVQKCNLN